MCICILFETALQGKMIKTSLWLNRTFFRSIDYLLPTNALNVNFIYLKMSKTVKYQSSATCFGNSTILREHTSFLTKATLVKNQ
jgi:hypothetical protein